MSFGSSVWGARDRASKFALNVDHGSHTISFKRIKSGCSLKQARGRYYYEHNQDGGGGWSASINLAIFTLSYDGKSGGTLQKSAPLDYLRD